MFDPFFTWLNDRASGPDRRIHVAVCLSGILAAHTIGLASWSA
jgi:hypothetical protein